MCPARMGTGILCLQLQGRLGLATHASKLGHELQAAMHEDSTWCCCSAAMPVKQAPRMNIGLCDHHLFTLFEWLHVL